MGELPHHFSSCSNPPTGGAPMQAFCCWTFHSSNLGSNSSIKVVNWPSSALETSSTSYGRHKVSTESLSPLPSTIQRGVERQRNQGQEARAPDASFPPVPCCPLLSSDSHLSLSVQFIECFLKNVHPSGLTGVQRRCIHWMAGEGGRQALRPRAPPPLLPDPDLN